MLSQKRNLFLRLHAFCNNLHIQMMCQADQSRNNILCAAAVADLSDKTDIQLNHIERVILDGTQRRNSASEIINQKNGALMREDSPGTSYPDL